MGDLPAGGRSAASVLPNRGLLAGIARGLAILLLCALPLPALSPAAAADPLRASTVRLSVAGGSPRSCQVYGELAGFELYVPAEAGFDRLSIEFRRRRGRVAVYQRGSGGARIARWKLRAPGERLPETGACALRVGESVYVPLRALAAAARLEIRWNEADGLISVVRRNERHPAPGRPPGPAPSRPSGGSSRSESPVMLTGVSLAKSNGKLRLSIRSSRKVTPAALTVRSPLPYRIALDFPRSRWAEGLRLPAGIGPVKGLRIGYPRPGTARLTLVISSSTLRVSSVRPENGAAAVWLEPSRAAPGASGAQTNSLRGRTVVVDPGHGGGSPGARGSRHMEKDLSLSMAVELARALRARGARVIMTRKTDVSVSLAARCAIANRSGADVFVSIHCNSTAGRSAARGSETYWYGSSGGYRLARALHPRLVRTVGSADRGIRSRGFKVVRETRMPAVLLEIGFLSHTAEEALLARREFQRRLGAQLAAGLADYFRSSGKR